MMENQSLRSIMTSRMRLRFDQLFQDLCDDTSWLDTGPTSSGCCDNSDSKRQIFNVFENSGLHKQPRLIFRDVYSIVEYRDKTSSSKLFTIQQNSKYKHSEENVIDFLTDLLKSGNLPSQLIKIYINFSPCWKCSEKLRLFIQDARTTYGVYLGMQIIFTFLYKIRRRSCENGSHAIPHKLPTHYDHGESLKGLKSLVDIGVTLRTFSKEDWLFIASFLDVSYNYEGTARQREDMLLKDDMEYLMKPPPRQGCMAAEARGPSARLRPHLMMDTDVFTMDAV